MVTGQKQDAQIKLDALTPIEMEEKAELAGISKAKMPAMPMFLLAIAAGAFIGLGGMYYCIIAADPNLGFAAKKMVGWHRLLPSDWPLFSWPAPSCLPATR